MIENYRITTNKNEMDIKAIHAYLTRSYWSENISLEDVQKAFDNSFCFGVLLEGKQIAYARVVTDFISLAYLADVYVLEEHRTKGIGKFLLDEILNHPDVKNIKRLLLITKDAHKLYEKFGFNELKKPENWMEKLLNK